MRNPEFRRPGATGRAPSFARVGALSWFALASILGTPSGARDKGPAVKAFDITVSRYKYDPSVIEVTEGDEVRLTLHSVDGTHGFAIKELKVKVTIPKGGAPVSAGFLASAGRHVRRDLLRVLRVGPPGHEGAARGGSARER